ncbi:hypothetical protein AVEN_5929-1 [Araneus ventricosus]|uniref:Uncharacterized protein n=1 Tax=Araneus ventricosus TaxID=182803 RepID=A0A4Y2EZB0_ARAVE|nr:hypothetical protein AVEN_5929-1 [Araneus ventricosus]
MGNKRLVSFTRQSFTTLRSDGTLQDTVLPLWNSLFSRPSTSGFLLVSTAERKLKGHRFADSDEVIENATKQLKDLSKNGFQECFE